MSIFVLCVLLKLYNILTQRPNQCRRCVVNPLHTLSRPDRSVKIMRGVVFVLHPLQGRRCMRNIMVVDKIYAQWCLSVLSGDILNNTSLKAHRLFVQQDLHVFIIKKMCESVKITQHVSLNYLNIDSSILKRKKQQKNINNLNIP